MFSKRDDAVIRPAHWLDADNEYAMIDTTIVRVLQHGVEAKGGFGQTGPRTPPRRHESQEPCHGQCGEHPDRRSSNALENACPQGIRCPAQGNSRTDHLASKDCDAHAWLIELPLDKGKAVVTPSQVTNKQPREHARDLYKALHLFEASPA